jgi:hypothetical protein
MHLTCALPRTCPRPAAQVLYMTISKVSKGSTGRHKGKEFTPVEVHCKDFQILIFHIPRAIDAIHVADTLTHFALPKVRASHTFPHHFA